MLLANMAVAHQIYRSNPELALLRRHAAPQSRLMEALQELCDHIGLDIDMSSAGALHVRHTNTCKSTTTYYKKAILTLPFIKILAPWSIVLQDGPFQVHVGGG